ncbi:MAG: hypothetical protein PW792_00635 [Acidobacteriaceae bacterium]|nr:hypothetical protein [Acidobacteriaceae bacterium]
MKTVWSIVGVFAAAAGVLLLTNRKRPVIEMAHQLEAAWADHHTSV